MVDYASARTKMVDGQIRPSDVTDYRIISAMLDIPRDAFLTPSQKPLAYSDLPMKFSDGTREMVLPMTLARLIQAAAIQSGDVVLDLGCGPGYSSAVIARLASSVVALEEDAAVAARAGETLVELGIDNVAVVTGRLAEGYPDEAPYDVIVIAGAVEVMPDDIGAQLKDGGRLVVIEGTGQAGRLMLYVKSGEDLAGRIVANASARVLPGFARLPEFEF
jgi:Protein-L-isoaspartate carboxylmethyltransferase